MWVSAGTAENINCAHSAQFIAHSYLVYHEAMKSPSKIKDFHKNKKKHPKHQFKNAYASNKELGAHP